MGDSITDAIETGAGGELQQAGSQRGARPQLTEPKRESRRQRNHCGHGLLRIRICMAGHAPEIARQRFAKNRSGRVDFEGIAAVAVALFSRKAGRQIECGFIDEFKLLSRALPQDESRRSGDIQRPQIAKRRSARIGFIRQAKEDNASSAGVCAQADYICQRGAVREA